jgi:hypothetical protein
MQICELEEKALGKRTNVAVVCKGEKKCRALTRFARDAKPASKRPRVHDWGFSANNVSGASILPSPQSQIIDDTMLAACLAHFRSTPDGVLLVLARSPYLDAIVRALLSSAELCSDTELVMLRVMLLNRLLLDVPALCKLIRFAPLPSSLARYLFPRMDDFDDCMHDKAADERAIDALGILVEVDRYLHDRSNSVTCTEPLAMPRGIANLSELATALTFAFVLSKSALMDCLRQFSVCLPQSSIAEALSALLGWHELAPDHVHAIVLMVELYAASSGTSVISWSWLLASSALVRFYLTADSPLIFDSRAGPALPECTCLGVLAAQVSIWCKWTETDVVKIVELDSGLLKCVRRLEMRIDWLLSRLPAHISTNDASHKWYEICKCLGRIADNAGEKTSDYSEDSTDADIPRFLTSSSDCETVDICKICNCGFVKCVDQKWVHNSCQLPFCFPLESCNAPSNSCLAAWVSWEVHAATLAACYSNPSSSSPLSQSRIVLPQITLTASTGGALLHGIIVGTVCARKQLESGSCSKVPTRCVVPNIVWSTIGSPTSDSRCTTDGIWILDAIKDVSERYCMSTSKRNNLALVRDAVLAGLAHMPLSCLPASCLDCSPQADSTRPLPLSDNAIMHLSETILSDLLPCAGDVEIHASRLKAIACTIALPLRREHLKAEKKQQADHVLRLFPRSFLVVQYMRASHECQRRPSFRVSKASMRRPHDCVRRAVGILSTQ